EVASLTDAFSTTYANPDGSFTYTASVDPVRAKNSAGKWAPIDTSLKRGNGGWSAVNSPYPVTFAAGDPGFTSAGKAGFHGARSSPAVVQAAYYRPTVHSAVQAADQTASWTTLVSMNAEGHEVTIEWPGTLPEPKIEGDRALYEGVFPGVDLLLT